MVPLINDNCYGTKVSVFQEDSNKSPIAGEYEAYKKKDKKKGGLYPLNEEGEYGPPPSALPPPLPGYKKRERKPKVYASYAISR